jgi:hypothetical protein
MHRQAIELGTAASFIAGSRCSHTRCSSPCKFGLSLVIASTASCSGMMIAESIYVAPLS